MNKEIRIRSTFTGSRKTRQKICYDNTIVTKINPFGNAEFNTSVILFDIIVFNAMEQIYRYLPLSDEVRARNLYVIAGGSAFLTPGTPYPPATHPQRHWLANMGIVTEFQSVGIESHPRQIILIANQFSDLR